MRYQQQQERLAGGPALPPIPRAGLLPTLDILLLHVELCQLRALRAARQHAQGGGGAGPSPPPSMRSERPTRCW
ncbi:hypothetical protein STCU_11695 [Strigomonas culicis]|uniref:Uncharacterized protein n=1 Tax=Strigomonas culicis TaxID=28005 RepID=S9UZA1_9TRYP|nr:hypothetical protein STCU_11695 [Strigomonas culicis]|eukprot:EPY15890.1 hypothetical protein STCU_11695 [Strigomonas culicis]